MWRGPGVRGVGATWKEVRRREWCGGWVSQGSFGSPAGTVQRAGPAFVTRALFMRWTFTEPLICGRLRPPGTLSIQVRRVKQLWAEVGNTSSDAGLSVFEAQPWYFSAYSVISILSSASGS